MGLMKDEYISKEQFCKECHVGEKTALWLIQSGLLPAINTMRKTDRYLISRTAVAHYLRNRELEPEKYRYIKRKCLKHQKATDVPEEAVDRLCRALMSTWASVPDVLRCHEVQTLLGYNEKVITRWRKELGLKYIKVSQTIYYPKKYLIEFLLSPQSQAQYVRSAEHIQLMRRIENV